MLLLVTILKAIPIFKKLKIDLSKLDKAGVGAEFAAVAPRVVSRLEAGDQTPEDKCPKREIIRAAMYYIAKYSIPGLWEQIPEAIHSFIGDKIRDRYAKKLLAPLAKSIPSTATTAQIVEATWRAMLEQAF